jgi:two-component system response regulator MprA
MGNIIAAGRRRHHHVFFRFVREARATMLVLVADDDRGVRDALDRALRVAGFETDLARDGLQTLAAIGRRPPDAVVLDVLMPEMDGLAVCRRLRASGDRTPVLLLTARDAVRDRVNGLEAGADDYLPKPFDLDELLARLRALIRRSLWSDPAEDRMRVADVELDLRAYEVRRGQRRLELTRTEFRLLELLLRHPGQVLTRELISERIWSYQFRGSSNPLEVYVGYLRRKLEADGESRLIHTVRGVGYVLREPQ